MDEQNYERVLRRRRYRLMRERKRRRRKLMMIYGVILSAFFVTAVISFGHLKGAGGKEQDSGVQGAGQPGESAKDKEEKGGIVQWVKGLLGGKDRSLATDSLPGNEAESLPAVEGLENGEPGGGTEPEGGQAEPSETLVIGEGDSGENEPDLTTPEGRLQDLLSRAERLAAGYDYDGAAALLLGDSEFSASEEVLAAVANYEAIKGTLVRQDISQIPHVFFHSIIMDTAKAFDGDDRESGYNQVMTTKSEFEKMLLEMYNRGFVLVRLHDMAHEETDETGPKKMVKGEIMLPEGKKPIVMSQDDVCYYEYMDGDGFASRMVVGADGKPACEMKMDDGSVAVGSFDLVPLLEDFIQEHPDFSYKGARAVIAFTGYEGILGYRTAADYKDKNPNYEADRQQAAAVAQCLRDNGWELASHSWGHRDLGKIEMENFIADTDKWEAEVESLIGPTDIILYPFGADVADWHSYSFDNERFAYLYNVGFRYFCNVDSSQNWVQLGDTYLRQGRRNLDGYRMWMDIAANQEGGSGKRRLDDLFNSEDIFDPARPTPVVWE